MFMFPEIVEMQRKHQHLIATLLFEPAFTRFHAPQLLNKSLHAALKILHAPTETRTNLKNIKSNTYSHMVGAYC